MRVICYLSGYLEIWSLTENSRVLMCSTPLNYRALNIIANSIRDFSTVLFSTRVNSHVYVYWRSYSILSSSLRFFFPFSRVHLNYFARFIHGTRIVDIFAPFDPISYANQMPVLLLESSGFFIFFTCFITRKGERKKSATRLKTLYSA